MLNFYFNRKLDQKNRRLRRTLGALGPPVARLAPAREKEMTRKGLVGLCGSRFCRLRRLLAQAERLNQRAIALDVFALEVVEQGAALAYELHESAFGAMIFTVRSHVLRQVGDTVREQGHLTFYRAGVRVGLPVRSKDLFLLS